MFMYVNLYTHTCYTTTVVLRMDLHMHLYVYSLYIAYRSHVRIHASIAVAAWLLDTLDSMPCYLTTFPLTCHARKYV